MEMGSLKQTFREKTTQTLRQKQIGRMNVHVTLRKQSCYEKFVLLTNVSIGETDVHLLLEACETGVRVPDGNNVSEGGTLNFLEINDTADAYIGEVHSRKVKNLGWFRLSSLFDYRECLAVGGIKNSPTE